MNQEFPKIDLIVLAGGKGSRLKNISKNYPKSLVKIKNINFMQLLLNKYCKYNFNKIYILVGYKKNYIINKFNNKISKNTDLEQLIYKSRVRINRKFKIL